MTYPIIEFDPTHEAFIEPAKVIRRRDVPEHCVICFFKDVLDDIVVQQNAKMLVENRWEDGPHPVYEIAYQGQRLAFYHPGIGSSVTAATLEEAIGFGCRRFIACGGSGVLSSEIAVGHLVVLSGAVRDEGASYHYLPPAREVGAHPLGVEALVNAFHNRGIPHLVGKTWTTDAPYRETPRRIAARKAEGCLVVEMEAAGMMAVAQFRQVVFGQVVYGGDDLSGDTWDNRKWKSRADIRKNLFWLCAEACLTLRGD